jgi:predicted P-loop ATPase
MTNDNEDNGEHDDDNDSDDNDSANYQKAAEEAIKRAKLRMVEGAATKDEALLAARLEDDLIKRGKAIFELGIEYPNTKQVKSGEQFVLKAEMTDFNRWTAMEALYGDGPTRPHMDTFRGRIVDHRGVIIDDHYSPMEITKALDAMNLKGHSAANVKTALRDFSLSIRFNDLLNRFERVIPAWDGVARMEKSLINMFELNDGELNKEFSVYFWLSLYNRITNPGCLAPMVLCLIGGQFTGKSHFANIICQAILGKPESHAIKLDLAKDWTPFLRQITGNSVIANVGEMTGYASPDMNRIKEFITQETDPFDYKFEGHIDQQRQWIIVMNGNSYDGLQRDVTGNRRFYPMFVGEKHVGALETLQSKWTPEYCAGVAAAVWPIMAECREWMRVNGGFDGYLKMVTDIAKKVFEFNKNEMDNDRGTIRDDDLDTFLIEALKLCEVVELNRVKNKGMFVTTKEIVNKVAAVSRDKVRVKMNHLPNKMKALGAESEMINNAKGYIFRNVTTYSDFLIMLKGGSSDTDEQVNKDRVIDPNINM